VTIRVGFAAPFETIEELEIVGVAAMACGIDNKEVARRRTAVNFGKTSSNGFRIKLLLSFIDFIIVTPASEHLRALVM
jgi:hypothetical protein